MPIFLSYSRVDEEPVKALAQGFELARRKVWFDRDLGGGEAWWDEILDNIRSASVFVFALSDASIHSKPCRSELDYALALKRSILPVQVGAVGSFRGHPLADRQTLFYRRDEALSAFEIIAAVDDAASTVRPLPSPLPPPPPIPFAYLLALGRQIDSTELNHADQLAVVDQLRRALGEETDQSVRRDIAAMLKNLANKPWATRRTENEVKAVIYAFLPPSESPVRDADNHITVAPKNEDPDSAAEDVADPPITNAPDVPATPPEPDGRMFFEQRLLALSKRQDDDLRAESARRATAESQSYREDRNRDHPDRAARAPEPPRAAPAATTPAPIWPGVSQPLVAPPRWKNPGPPVGRTEPATTNRTPSQGTTRVNAPAPPAASPVRVAGSPRPSAFWPLSVLALISVIFGIVALVYSTRTDRLVGEGDITTAQKASNWALVWGLVGVILGGLFWIAVLTV